MFPNLISLRSGFARLLLAALLVAGSSGCVQAVDESGDEPEAASPSGPEEIPGPSALRFPGSVTIDVSETTRGGVGALAVSQKGFIGTAGEFTDLIAGGSEITDIITQIVDRIISRDGVLGDVVVEISSDVTTYSSTVPVDSPVLAGESLKIDFSDFEFPGKTTACSGSTEGSLVCYRVWIGGRKVLGGYFTSIPTEEDDGAGHLWFVPLAEFFADIVDPPSAGESFSVGVSWDRRDPALRVADVAFSSEEGSSFEHGHALITEEGTEEWARIKTLNLRLQSDEDAYDQELKYLGRWKEDEDFWSGKVLTTGDGAETGNLNICARLSTGGGVADSNCAAIDTDDETFVDPAAEEDFTFPTDFPSAPEF